MASRILFSPFTHRVGLIAGLGLGSAALFPSLLSPYHKSRLLYCDSSVGPKDWSLSQYQHDARTPIVKNGKLNSGAIKQLSSGSICGLIGGLAVSAFSKPLALLLGLLIFGVQALESRGIHLIPYGKLQQYFTSIDLRSAIQDNAAFKLSFGATRLPFDSVFKASLGLAFTPKLVCAAYELVVVRVLIIHLTLGPSLVYPKQKDKIENSTGISSALSWRELSASMDEGQYKHFVFDSGESPIMLACSTNQMKAGRVMISPFHTKLHRSDSEGWRYQLHTLELCLVAPTPL
ncbi:hypothetical protein M8818_002489 [Zalaria obscura]|uniref:Uncharacterized protein n=1 Tax=Zalaria obscura TaxID=2024903 RepID=A0ACC3SI13_9PEZI